MFGEISAWYYKALGGIKPDPKNPGFKNVILEPHFVDGLEYFEARHKGPYGEILSSWKRTNNKVLYKISIPPNSTATLSLNGKNISGVESIPIKKLGIDRFKLSLPAGSYELTIEE